MDPLIIVSPHFDDAVLSCGQFMAGYPGVTVATVFSAPPPNARTTRTTYDLNCGFTDAADALAKRKREDRAALDELAAEPRHLGFVDGQYVEKRWGGEQDRMVEALRRLVNDTEARRALVPLGLAHPDHMLTADACRSLVGVRDLELVLYEELPARVLWPEQVPAALDRWREVDGVTDLSLGFIGTGDAEAKERALYRYASQLWGLDPHAVRCPERYWIVSC